MVIAKQKMMMVSGVFEKIASAFYEGKDHIWLEGGTWATKTYSVLQFLKMLCDGWRGEPLLITVSSETLPHLKRGCVRDFTAIMGDDWDDRCWNKTDLIYTWKKNDCMIEYVGADQPAKLRGPRRKILFFNELNNIMYDTYREADVRTTMLTIGDWNPVGEFWWHDRKMEDESNSETIRCTYKDAVGLIPQNVIEDIESAEFKDPNWWSIYGLGILGKITGKVHPEPVQVDRLPEGNPIYGLDFGFEGDPTVLTRHVIVVDNLFSQQMFYNNYPMTNDDIAKEMELLGVSHDSLIYPDPNEPKSAEELRRKGFNIGDTVKGKGSVKFGIQRVNQYFQHWTKDSVECIKEQRNYRYIKRKEPSSGREYLSDDTTHQWSHGMDSRRYAVASQPSGVELSYMPMWEF